MAYLEQADQQGRRTFWRQVYDPVSVEANVAQCEFLIGQLRGLWSVARGRYGYYSPENPGYVTNFPAWWVDHLRYLGHEGQTVGIGRVTRNLVYLDRPLQPPAEVPPT